MKKEFYFTESENGYVLKERGGFDVIRVFLTKEQAIHYAQQYMAKNPSIFKLQDYQGKWVLL